MHGINHRVFGLPKRELPLGIIKYLFGFLLLPGGVQCVGACQTADRHQRSISAANSVVNGLFCCRHGGSNFTDHQFDAT